MPAAISFTLASTSTDGSYVPADASLTAASLGSAIPQWGLFVLTTHDGGAETANAAMSIGVMQQSPTQGTAGAYAAASTEFSVFPLDTDATKTYNRCSSTEAGSGTGLRYTNQVIKSWTTQFPSGGTSSAHASVLYARDNPTGPFIAGGVNVTYGNGDAVSSKGFCTLGGSWGCTKSHIGQIALGTGLTPVTETMLPDVFAGEPDFVVFFDQGIGGHIVGTPPAGYDDDSDFSGQMIGIAVNDGPLTQKCAAWMEAEASLGAPYQYLSSDHCVIGQSPTATTVLYKAKITDFANNSFTITPTVTDGVDRVVMYMAVKLSGGNKSLFELSAPVAAGATAYTNPGFTPNHCIIVGTGLAAYDTSTTGTTAGSLGISAFTATTAQAAVARTKNANPASATLTAAKALQWGDGDSTAKVIATLTSFDANGFTLNYSATTSGVKGFCLALAAESACGNNFAVSTARTDNRLYGNFKKSSTAPVITSDGGGPTATVNVSTGDTAVTTVQASGFPASTYSIVGGANAALFQINSSSGALSFLVASVDGNYVVIVKALNNRGSDTQTITAAVATALAKGIHLDGNTSVSTASLTATDSSDFACFQWFNSALQGPQLWMSNSNQFTCYLSIEVLGPNVRVEVILANGAGSFALSANNNDVTPADANWHWVLIGADTNHGVGLKKIKMYIDGVDVTANITDGSIAFNVEMNGFDFFVGEDGFSDFIEGNFSTTWIAPGVQLLDGGGNIPIATRNLFVLAGQPQDPAGFPGTPAILLDGNAAAWGTNQGTGGALTLNGGPITNAATNPP